MADTNESLRAKVSSLEARLRDAEKLIAAQAVEVEELEIELSDALSDLKGFNNGEIEREMKATSMRFAWIVSPRGVVARLPLLTSMLYVQRTDSVTCAWKRTTKSTSTG